jgi:predicted nucleic acid-binding protein
VFILDTMVVSERTKPRPDANVRAWLNTIEPASQFISAISVGEISFGIRRMPAGRDKQRLEAWLDGELIPLFAGRILSVDLQVARRWGALRHEVGRSLSAADSLIGATAFVHGLAVATRNERDFADLGVRVVNPWSA